MPRLWNRRGTTYNHLKAQDREIGSLSDALVVLTSRVSKLEDDLTQFHEKLDEQTFHQVRPRQELYPCPFERFSHGAYTRRQPLDTT